VKAGKMMQQSIEQLSLEQLNEEYSPSSCIEDINVYIQQYVEQSRKAKNNAIALEKLHSDQYYGEGKTQRLDIYLPIDKPKQRLMVYIHGGYWQELSKEESCFAATNFQQQGFHFAVLDYTLAPDASLSDIVEENRQAITWLHQNAALFGYDPEQIYLCGSSAGAHLAMMMLQTKWANYIADYQGCVVKGVCAVSGVYDLLPLLPTYVNDALKMDSQEAKKNSPVLQPLCSLASTVPVIIAFGDIETSEFKRQSEIMTEKLADHGVDVRFKEIVERNHFDVILDLGDKSTWVSQQAIAMMS
jgi:arylformamidase